MAMIDFKTAPMEDIHAHMESTEYGILDTTRVPKDAATGVFAILPIVGYITGKNNDNSGKAVREIIKGNPYFKDKIRKTKFNGFNDNQPSWSATLPVIFELIMVLSGTGAAEFRRTCAQYVVRVFAGDVSLIDKIEENNKAFSQTEEGRKVQEAMLSGVDPVLGKRAREDDDMDRAKIKRINAETEYLQMQTELMRMQLQGGVKRTGTWSQAFATYEPEEAQPFKLAYNGLAPGVSFKCFIDGCNNTFTNSRSYHQHIFRDHKKIPEGERPHPDWPRSAFVIHKDEQKKTEADYFDNMSKFDRVTKRWRMQCNSTEYWMKTTGYGMTDTGERCGQWFDSYGAFRKHEAERHAKPKNFAQGTSMNYTCEKEECEHLSFRTKAEERAHFKYSPCGGKTCQRCRKPCNNLDTYNKHLKTCKARR